MEWLEELNRIVEMEASSRYRKILLQVWVDRWVERCNVSCEVDARFEMMEGSERFQDRITREQKYVLRSFGESILIDKKGDFVVEKSSSHAVAKDSNGNPFNAHRTDFSFEMLRTKPKP